MPDSAVAELLKKIEDDSATMVKEMTKSSEAAEETQETPEEQTEEKVEKAEDKTEESAEDTKVETKEIDLAPVMKALEETFELVKSQHETINTLKEALSQGLDRIETLEKRVAPKRQSVSAEKSEA